MEAILPEGSLPESPALAAMPASFSPASYVNPNGPKKDPRLQPILLLILVLGGAFGAYAMIPQTVSGLALLKNQSSGKCLDVVGGSVDDGAQIRQFTCNGGSSEQWLLIPDEQTPGYVQVVNIHSAKCLDVPDASVDDGVTVQQFICNDGTNQRWRFVPDDQGNLEVINLNSGKCLDVPNGSPVGGALIQQFRCHGGPNQLWQRAALL
jgi:hypothetical protein